MLDLEEVEVLRIGETRNYQVSCITFVKDVAGLGFDAIVAGCIEGYVLLWRLEEQNRYGGNIKTERRAEFLDEEGQSHGGKVTCIMYSSHSKFSDGDKGLIFSGSQDRNVRVWSIWKDRGCKAVQNLVGHNGTITRLVDGHDGSVLSLSTDGTIRVWAPQRGRQLLLNPFFENVHTINYASLSATSSKDVWLLSDALAHLSGWTLYVGDSQGHISLFGKSATTAQAAINVLFRDRIVLNRRWQHIHSLGVCGLTLVPDQNFLVTQGYDCCCKVVDAGMGQIYFTIDNTCQIRFTGVYWNQDNEELVLGDEQGNVQIWSAFREKMLFQSDMAGTCRDRRAKAERERLAILHARKRQRQLEQMQLEQGTTGAGAADAATKRRSSVSKAAAAAAAAGIPVEGMSDADPSGADGKGGGRSPAAPSKRTGAGPSGSGGGGSRSGVETGVRGRMDPGGVRCMVSGPDGTFFTLCNSYDEVQQWKVTRNLLTTQFVGHEDGVLAIALTPHDEGSSVNGSRASSASSERGGSGGGGGEAKADDGNVLRISAAERLFFTASYDNTIRCWDEYEHAEMYRLKEKVGEISCMLMLWHMNLLVVGREDGYVDMWTPDTGAHVATKAHQNTVTCAIEARNARVELVVTGGYDGTIGIWNVSLFHTVRSHLPFEARIQEAHGVPRETYAAASASESASASSSSSSSSDLAQPGIDINATLQTIMADHGTLQDCEVIALAFHAANQQVISSGNDKRLRVWSLVNFTCACTLAGLSQVVTTMAVDGDFLIAGDEAGGITLLNLVESSDGIISTLAHMDSGHGCVRDIALVPSLGFFATCGDDRTSRLWDYTAPLEDIDGLFAEESRSSTVATSTTVLRTTTGIGPNAATATTMTTATASAAAEGKQGPGEDAEGDKKDGTASQTGSEQGAAKDEGAEDLTGLNRPPQVAIQLAELKHEADTWCIACKPMSKALLSQIASSESESKRRAARRGSLNNTDAKRVSGGTKDGDGDGGDGDNSGGGGKQGESSARSASSNAGEEEQQEEEAAAETKAMRKDTVCLALFVGTSTGEVGKAIVEVPKPHRN